MIQAYLLDSIDFFIIGLLLLSIVNLWKTAFSKWVNLFAVPCVITYGLYFLLPSFFIRDQYWLWGIFFLSMFLIAPHRKLPKPASLQLSWLFLFIAIGVFILRSMFWGYFLFNSAVQERPGSFRMEGVVWANQQAQAWQFSSLKSLIQTHWYYPSAQERYIYPYPDNAEELLSDGITQAEDFRLSILEDNNGSSQIELLSAAMIDFQAESEQFLSGRPNLERFDLNQEELINAVKGTFGVAGVGSAFSYFEGKWYGSWDGNEVNHEWRHLYMYDPPKHYTEADVNMYLSQYAWIGDGFGWNLYAHKPDVPDHSFILGAVYHVRDQDPSQVYHYRPHVGIDMGSSKLIWITEGEVFFEETLPPNDEDPDRYAITGFFYNHEEGVIKIKECFQAIYTRDPDNRPGFYKFNLNLF